MAFYSSHGAAQEVTGSCHLLEIAHLKILIDCGLFQGKEEKLNYEEFSFDVSDINYLILTHAHLDHIGRVPLLIKKGFNGKIITTKATFDLAKLMLKNAASILEQKKDVLYYQEDVDKALEFFSIFVEYGETLELEEDVKITFKNAGHILGSACVKIEYFEDSMQKSALFSGDIGQHSRVITSNIQYFNNANYVFIESTYANRLHEELDISIEEFKTKILHTLKNNGVVLLPSFALERTQEILFILKALSKEGHLKDVPVYLDSPLAIDVTKTFLKYPTLFNEQVQELIEKKENPFYFKELITTYNRDESIAINKQEGKKIIIAGSGMCEGGRIPFHLSRYATSKRNLILFVGYQVAGTVGRKILDDKKEVLIDNQEITIKAKVAVVSGFSAHADKNDLLNFLKALEDIYCIYLIHGQQDQLSSFKKLINKELEDKVHIVKMKEKIYI